MATILEELLSPNSVDEFLAQSYRQAPVARPSRANHLKDYVDWQMMDEIFVANHQDCWLACRGRLHTEKSDGSLSPMAARAGYANGATVLVRHAERAHAKALAITDEFARIFPRPLDLQIYLTPAGEQGFDWHYDLEDVFVLQTSGAKEFYLLENTVCPRPLPEHSDLSPLFAAEKKTKVIACRLEAGDWLYIPAGYWHKAIAREDSIHMSVGVLN